jgi:hypothetical protein
MRGRVLPNGQVEIWVSANDEDVWADTVTYNPDPRAAIEAAERLSRRPAVTRSEPGRRAA